MAIKRGSSGTLYTPWWINISDPFSIEEEPYNPYYTDDEKMSLQDIADEFLIPNVPKLWDLAGDYNISEATFDVDENGNKVVSAPEWPDEAKEFYSNPANRTLYLLNNYEPLSGLKEKSAYHDLDIGFMEKWQHSVNEPFETSLSIGLPGMTASATELTQKAFTALENLSDNLNAVTEATFGDPEVVKERAEGLKHWPFTSSDEVDYWRNQYQDKLDRIKKEKAKDTPDKETIKFLDDFNEWAETIAIKNIKALERRRAKDMRYQAWQQYAANKPVSWLTTFKSPEYFTDTALAMVPSVVVMGATMGAGLVGGASAAIGTSFIGHFPLEATGSYMEAYRWTMDETGDEELAKANAAWSTAEYLTFVAVTEGWGALRWFNRIIPNNIKKGVKNKAWRTLYKSNLYEKTGEFSTLRAGALREMAKNWVKGKGVPATAYNLLKDPFSEGLQEYVQYAGNILSEAGYKGESRNIVDILRMEHPLVDEAELHESVVGGALFGAGVGVATYSGKKLLWDENTNTANRILLNEYGVDTGVPNADLSDDGLYNAPKIVGDVKPTLENYLNELLYPKSDERVVVSRPEAEGTPLGKLMNSHKGYTHSAISEKIAEAIVKMGGDEWDNLSLDTKNSVNEHLKGALQNITGGQDILDAKILDNNDNIAKDILDGKITFQSTRVGTKITSTSNRKIKIKDKGYADSIIKMYESEISESLEGKEITPSNTRNYLAREYGIDLDKGLKKEITSSIQKHVEGEISTQVQKEAEKAAEKQIEQEMEKETLKAIQKKVGIQEYKDKKKEEGVSPKVEGQQALVVEGKHKGKSGKIIAHSIKQKLVKIELEDGTRIGPLKESDVALQMPTKTAEPKTEWPEEHTSSIKRVIDEVADPNLEIRHDGKVLVNGEVIRTYYYLKQKPPNDSKDTDYAFGDDVATWIANKIAKYGLKSLTQAENYVYVKMDGGLFDKVSDKLTEIDKKHKKLIAEEKKETAPKSEKEAPTPTKKKKPTAKQELKQKVNKVLDIKSEYDALFKAIELEKAAGQVSEENSKKLSTLKNKLRTAYDDVEIREELSKRGVLKAIERILIEDETPQQKKFHKIGDAYEKGEKKATKAFIAKAVNEIMGRHAPDIEKIFKNEIKEDPRAVGAYSEGMVEFVEGRATQRTAYHEPIHWFMNRVLDDKDYNAVIDHFGDEESATSAAADWYMGQKDRTLTEKIIDIFRRFWTKIRKFFNMQVTSEENILDIFSRIGRDFTIRNFKDRMVEYEIGVDVELDGLEPTLLPAQSETSYQEMLDKFHPIPVSEYRPRQRTLANQYLTLHSPTMSGNYNAIHTSEVPAADYSKISLPYVYGFSNMIAQLKGETISLGSPFSTKGLSPYESAVVDKFYKNAIDAEWTEGKKSVDKNMLITQYESFIENEFPLNAYSVRHQSRNIGKHGNAVPTLFNSLLPQSNKSSLVANDFYSARIMFTDENFYNEIGHSFHLDPTSTGLQLGKTEKAKSAIGTESKINGLGWYVYVEPRIKGVKQLEGMSLIYEIQQDINDVIDKMDNVGDVKHGLLPDLASNVESGHMTVQEAAEMEIAYKARIFLQKRMDMEAIMRGHVEVVNTYVNKSVYIGGMITQPHTGKFSLNTIDRIDIENEVSPALRFQSFRGLVKDKILDLREKINHDIKQGIVHRLMQKIEYADISSWNNFIKKVPLEGEYDYDVYKKYLDKYTSSLLLLDVEPFTGDLENMTDPPVFYSSEMGGQRFYIGRESGDLLGVQSISKILNALKLDKESKKYVLSELKKYENKFPNVVVSGSMPTLDIEDGKGVDKGYYLKSPGLELMLREALTDMVKEHSIFIQNVLPSSIKRKQTTPPMVRYWQIPGSIVIKKDYPHIPSPSRQMSPFSAKETKNAITKYINSYFSKQIRDRKRFRRNKEASYKKLRSALRLLSMQLDRDWTNDISGQNKVIALAQRYVDRYNRQIDGLKKNLQNKADLYVEDYQLLKSSIAKGDLQKTEQLRLEQKKFKEKAIHHSILHAHSRGNRIWALAGAEATLRVEGDVSSAMLYLTDWELNDPDRAKTYEEWKIKSLGQRRPQNMVFVDREFGLQIGNHLKSDEQLDEGLSKLNIDDIFRTGNITVKKDSIAEVDEDGNPIPGKYKTVWYAAKGKYTPNWDNQIEITYEEARELYRDAPKTGVVWRIAKNVLRKLGLKPEWKKYSALEGPVVIVQLPDNELEIAPVKRFHRIEEETEFERTESKSEELSRKTGVKDKSTVVKNTILDDASNLSRAMEKFNVPEKIKDLFSLSFNKARDKYGIEVADYVPIMGRSLRVIPNRETRDMVKNLLSEWAVSIDPDVGIKMRSDNQSMKLMELMGLRGRKEKRIKRQIADLDVVENIERTLAGQGAEDSHGLVREGLHVSDVTDMEELENNSEVQVYNFADDRFFKFLESTTSMGYLSPEETAELMSQVTINDFDGFTSFLSDTYNWEPVETADNNMVKSFWLRNQPINRQLAYGKPSWWYANMTFDGKVLSNKQDKRLVPKVGGHPKYGKDIRNNKDLARTMGVSFLDWDNISYEWGSGGDITYSTLYLKDMVDVHKGEDKGGFYSTQSYVVIDGILIRTIDRKLAQYADDEIGDGLARTIVIVNAGGNRPSFLIAKASKDIMDIASEVDSIVEYLDYEVSIGNMTDANKKELLMSMANESQKSPLNKHVEAQHILQYEVMKRARGRNYLIRNPDVSHHSRRFGIDDGQGIVALGTGDYTIKIIDQSKAFVSKGAPGLTGSSKKIPMTDYIAGLPDKYHGDGALWVESEYLDKTAYSVGRVPTGPNSSKLREIKTRIRFISKNDEFGRKHYKQEIIPGEARDLATEEQIEGTHYLALKHNEFVVEEDIYITDENDNVIAYTVNVDGNIRIYDGEENRMTMFGTLDEAKEPDGGSGLFKLDGRISTDILTLPEDSRRIVKVPKQQGHNSAAFPWMWMSHLYDSSFDGLRNALLTRMLNVARGNMNALFSARNNPQIMRALMGQFKSDGLTIMSEVDRLIEPKPGQMLQDGFMFPHIITGIIDPVKNRIIKENSYGGRRRGFGTFPTIKADLSRTIVKKEDGVVVSADDLTMLRFLKDFLNVEGFGNELVENINEALRTRKEYLMAGRWPVYTLSSMYLARIEKVMPRGHGAVVWFHPESALGKLQADNDGDTGFLLAPYFGQNYMDRTIVNQFNNKSTKNELDKRQSFVRLEYFKRPKTEFKMTSKKDMYIVAGKLGRGINAQGMMMNAVTFLEDMYYKNLKMDIGGQSIVVRNPDQESIVMTYAPLLDNVTQEMLNDANMGTLVNKDGEVWESGDKYLKTTPLKQLYNLLQAAVDNPKEYLLADWGFAGWKWLIPRIFIQDNGSPVGSKQAGSIASLVRKELMLTVVRRGQSISDGRNQDIDGMFESSKEIYELNQMSGVERGKIIKEKANNRRTRYGDKSKLANRTSEIEKVTFNNKLLPLEKLIAIPHESLIQYQQSNPFDKVHGNPFGYHPNRIQRAIMHTQQDMYTLQRETERWYPETKEFEKDKQVGRRLVNEMTREFYKIMMQQRMYNDSTKSRITSAGYPYQEKINEFIEKWLNKGDKKKGLPAWKDLTEEQQGYATLRFLRGVLTFSSETHKKVGAKEKRLQNAIIDLKAKAAEETDLSKVEAIENKIQSLENQLHNVYTPKTYQNISRPRDIEKMLPMPLMHPDVWTSFANLFGPNLRRASSKRISLKSDARYEDRKRRVVEEIIKECG